MYYENNLDAVSYDGIPYQDINWYDVVGQPFGIASFFNAFVLGDANNIVDTKGAFAVGGNFVSPRGLSLGYGNDGNLTGVGYSPDFVRFLVGRDVAMQGPLVVIGHVVAGGNFRAAAGSTYMIGKSGSPDQEETLNMLYAANGGSRYWRLSDRGSHYAVSSYDVPRFIPAARINADVRQFFADARESLEYYHDCITDLEPNGSVVDHFHEWILRGADPDQNVFVLDARPNGILNKQITLDIPEGSLAIVILRTGSNAHLQYGLWGDERNVNNTLYVFEDATNIFMEVPAAIWGSILAPQAMFHAHRTGGNVNGNAVLGSFAVNANSGFEFHLYPFAGGILCDELAPAPPVEIPEEIPVPLPTPVPQPAPIPQPVPTHPAPQPAPVAPAPAPCPPCPEPLSCPEAPPCPEPLPCPEAPPCPEPLPCPEAPPCPEALPCPEQRLCPECPSCPEQQPCPECPSCPEPITQIEYRAVPIPVPIRERITTIKYRPARKVCCPKCVVTPGIILGCIWGCSCCCDHEWEVKLYQRSGERKKLLYCETVSSCGCFQFEVPYDKCYLLEICSVGGRRGSVCKPMLTLKNVGVSDLMIN